MDSAKTPIKVLHTKITAGIEAEANNRKCGLIT